MSKVKLITSGIAGIKSLVKATAPVKVGKPNINAFCSEASRKFDLIAREEVKITEKIVKESGINPFWGDSLELASVGIKIPDISKVEDIVFPRINIVKGKKILPVKGYKKGIKQLVSEKGIHRPGKSKKSPSNNPLKKFFKNFIKNPSDAHFVGLDRNLVKALDKMPEDEFLVKSVQLLSKKLGIPEELVPQIVKVNLVGPFEMQYAPALNQLQVNTRVLQATPRSLIFGNLKHELTHAQQVIDILRTKSIGEKAVKRFSKNLAQVNCAQIEQIAKTFDDAQIMALATHPDFQLIQTYRNLLKQSPSEADKFMQQVFEATIPNTDSVWAQRRQFILDKLGEIIPTSKKGKDTKLFFEYFKKGSSANVASDCKAASHYANQKAEKLAYEQTDLGVLEYMFPEVNTFLAKA